MDNESSRLLFLKLIKETLSLSFAEINDIDRLLQRIQTGARLQRDELLYFAELKRNAELAQISMPTSKSN